MALRTTTIVCVTLLAAVFMTASVRAQSPDSDDIPEIHFEHLTTADGLSQGIVYDILEDHEGYMWFATRDGLNRYDGHRFKVYRHDPNDSTTISDSKVLSLFLDRDSVLWAGTMSAGLNRFDRSTETFSRFPLTTEKGAVQAEERILSIVQDSAGVFWLGVHGRGIVRFDPALEGRRFYPVYDMQHYDSSGAVAPTLKDVFIDRHDRLWTLCGRRQQQGLGWFNPLNGQCTLIKDQNGLSVGAESFASSSQGGFWALGNNINSENLIRRTVTFINESSQSPQLRTVLRRGSETKIVEDSRGLVWSATDGGIVIFDPVTNVSREVAYRSGDPTSLMDEQVMSIFADESGGVWVGGTIGISVFQPSGSPFHTYETTINESGAPRNSSVNAIHDGKDGTLWIGKEVGLGSLTVHRDEYTSHPQAPLASVILFINRVWSLQEDNNGSLWIGTGGAGLHRLDKESGRFTHEGKLNERIYDHMKSQYPMWPDRPQDGERILDIFEDRKNDLWFCTKHLLARRASKTGSYRLYNGLREADISTPHNFCNTFYQDSLSRYWVGSDLGLFRLYPDSGRFERHGLEAGRFGGAPDLIWTMAETSVAPAVLWVGTVGNGLKRFDPAQGDVRAYTTSDGLPSNIIYGILSDEEGNLWMSTGRGLSRFDPASEMFTNYDEGDGLPGAFDLMSYHKSPRTGEMFFGGPDGFVAFFPNAVTESTYEPEVAITGVTVFDEERPGMHSYGDTLTLSHTENFFALSFAAFDFTNPPQNRYRYRLEGFDPDWRLTNGHDPRASYTGVPPGNYRFIVYGSNHDGVFSDQHAAIFVNIVPAFWQTTAFRVAIIVLLLSLASGIVYGFQRQRIRDLYRRFSDEAEAKQRLAESREAERVRIAQELHDGPMQALYRLGHQLDDVETHINQGKKPDLGTPRERIEQLAYDLRAVCNALRPPILEHFGLIAGLEHLVERLRRDHPELRVNLDLGEVASDLDDAAQHAVFRIAQEALHNAAQHGKAEKISLALRGDDSRISLLIEDDGQGFEIPKSWVEFARAKHFGLLGMKERAEGLGGTCIVESAPGSGTRLDIEIPWTASSTRK